MNGISTDALVGLIGVGLGFLGSLIVMLVGNWLQAWREDRRIADERRYEWVKERLGKIEPYLARLESISYELIGAANGVLAWTLAWWQAPRSERPQITGAVNRFVNALKVALERRAAIRKEPPEIVFGSLEPQVLDAVFDLATSFGNLCVACSQLLSEREKVSQQTRNSNDLSTLGA